MWRDADQWDISVEIAVVFGGVSKQWPYGEGRTALNTRTVASLNRVNGGRGHQSSPAQAVSVEPEREDHTWTLRLARVIHEFAHLQSMNAAKWMKPLGVSLAQSNVLIGISWHREVSSSQLARSLGLSKVSVGRVVHDLIWMGLVEARPDPGDRRVSYLRLTSSGRKMVARFAEIGHEVNKIVMAGIDEAEGLELLDLFERMKTRTLAAMPERKHTPLPRL